jgi:DNA-binding CsgD family transcriptional regulator
MELFGPSGRDCPCRGETPAGLAFRERLTGFVHGLCCPANSRFFWENETGRRWEFSFQLQRSSSEPRRFKDRSVVLVTQVPNEHSEAESVFPARSLLEGYGLTDREVDVVREVYRGRSNKDIADLFRIAEPTVKSHLGSVYEKTGSASRTALLFKLSL